MKFVILIYSNPRTWVHPEISESGELIDTAPLADPINTRTVRLRGHTVVATDGPFLEAKEHLAGYFVVDCDSLERATEIAARFPDARQCAIEVRPIMDSSGQEM